jgi:hypothetical protein
MDWITIGTYGSVVEAEIVKGRLETEGIRAIVADETAGGVMPFLAGSAGVRVQVEESDVDRARTILAEAAG